MTLKNITGNKQFKFGKFRQKMCNLLWECGCDNIALSDETNAKQIFNNANYICNKLLEEYNIFEK